VAAGEGLETADALLERLLEVCSFLEYPLLIHSHPHPQRIQRLIQRINTPQQIVVDKTVINHEKFHQDGLVQVDLSRELRQFSFLDGLDQLRQLHVVRRALDLLGDCLGQGGDCL
jgi:hypothetical protein